MRYPVSEQALVTLLRQCYARPRCQLLRPSHRALSTLPLHNHHRRPSQTFSPSSPSSPSSSRTKLQTRTITTTSNDHEKDLIDYLIAEPQEQKDVIKNVAVFGSGITGLSTAWFLTRLVPDAKVTIYESGEEAGGWLRSKYLEVEGGKILFELGPRTLRAQGTSARVMLGLIQQLGIEDQVITTPKTSPAATNRYIYYPDHLVQMPSKGQGIMGNFSSIWNEELWSGLLPSLYTEWNTPCRSFDFEDESISSFLERRFGSRMIGDKIVSAVLHGIYAGNIEKLSAKSLIPGLWTSEQMEGGILKGFLRSAQGGGNTKSFRDLILEQGLQAGVLKSGLDEIMRDTSVYSFKEGIATVTTALERKLKGNKNVVFRMKDKVTGIEYDEKEAGVLIKSTNSTTPLHYTHSISTLSAPALASITSPTLPLPTLAKVPSVTVMVINLYYPPPFRLPISGFGYLIPLSIPLSENPEKALGVVFDSDAIQGQDLIDQKEKENGVKITVMMGGHLWEGYQEEDYPSESEAVEMARSVVRRHLGIEAAPEVTRCELQKDCIPQYVVGHEEEMRKAGRELERGFKGRLLAVGNSYGGVGLNDCVKGAFGLVNEMRQRKVVKWGGIGGDIWGWESRGQWIGGGRAVGFEKGGIWERGGSKGMGGTARGV